MFQPSSSDILVPELRGGSESDTTFHTDEKLVENPIDSYTFISYLSTDRLDCLRRFRFVGVFPIPRR